MANTWYITVAKELDRGSSGPPNWWWTTRTPEEQTFYEQTGETFRYTTCHCAFTRWGAKSAAKAWARRKKAQGDEVVWLKGTLADTKKEEQEQIDKEFEKLQRKLAKETKRGTLL